MDTGAFLLLGFSAFIKKGGEEGVDTVDHNATRSNSRIPGPDAAVIGVHRSDEVSQQEELKKGAVA